MTSTVQIVYDPLGADLDITDHVLFEDATFETQMNAIPGTATFRVKDENRSYIFITGREIRLYIDGVQMWGGYIRRVSRGFFFPADDTNPASTFHNRAWTIEAVDYNILLDNRIIRRTDNYTGHVPDSVGYPKTTDDGWALWKLLYSYSDFPHGSRASGYFDITSDRTDATEIENITTVLPSDSTSKFKYKQQGTQVREQFVDLAKMAGAVFYISGDRKVHYHPWEKMTKRWGFSDIPNYNAITASPDGYQGADWGFHEVVAEEDGALITNDAIVWGGSPIGSDGTVLYARVTNQDSIDEHGRWQIGESHFNELGTQAGVNARANVIIFGPPGSTDQGVLKGLRYPQWVFRFQWWADKVPTLSGSRDHIMAGEFMRIELNAFSLTGSSVKYAPCRTLKITFPELDPQGNAHALFTGEFSFSYTDSIAMWRSMFDIKKSEAPRLVATVGNNSTTAKYGDFGLFTAFYPDGYETEFDLPNDFGYITQTLIVVINGLEQIRDTDYTETDPVAGTFTMSTAPSSTDTIMVHCRMLAKT